MSVRSSTAGWLLRILLLAAGVAGAILALWVFYFRPWLWASSRLAFLVGLGAIAYQAHQTLSGNTPGPIVWLVGIGVFLLTAILWDAVQPAELVRTLADLTVAIVAAG